MAHSLDRAVVEIHMRHFDIAGTVSRDDGEPVILGSYLDPARFKVLDRLVPPWWPNLSFTMFAPNASPSI